MFPKTSLSLAFFTKSIKRKKKRGREDGQMEGHTNFLTDVPKTQVLTVEIYFLLTL